MIPAGPYIPLAEPSQNAAMSLAFTRQQINAKIPAEPAYKVRASLVWRIAILLFGLAVITTGAMGRPGSFALIPPLGFSLTWLAACYLGCGKYKEIFLRANVWITHWITLSVIGVACLGMFLLPPGLPLKICYFGLQYVFTIILITAAIALLRDIKTATLARQVARYRKTLSRTDRKTFDARLKRDLAVK